MVTASITIILTQPAPASMSGKGRPLGRETLQATEPGRDEPKTVRIHAAEPDSLQQYAARVPTRKP
jgi:hypothetical protein